MIENILRHGAFAAMRQYRQFIVVLSVPKPGGGTNKFPIDWRTGQVTGAHDAAIWLDAESAARYAHAFGGGYGIGFVFTAGDPFFFVDIDSCLIEGVWSPIAHWCLELFSGACVEVSQSGAGLHIFGTGRAPEHRKRNQAYGLEFYTELRFVALTGTHCSGDSARDCTGALAYLVPQLFAGHDSGGDQTPLEWTTAPCPEWRGPADDAELIRRAYRSQSAGAAFGNKASFADLWDANESRLALAYPSATPGASWGYSEADAALALHLMFWTGKDCERVERLMRQSKLLRSKWDERDDYLRGRTIMNALRMSRDVLQDQPLPGTGATTPTDQPRPAVIAGATFLGPDQQTQMFAGCVYVSDAHRILVPGGRMLKHEQFRAHFGGYTFAMDNVNERTTRDAWEAFTESQVLRAPRVDSATFAPAEAPGAVFERGGETVVNTYWPVNVPRQAGDASRFYAHLAKLLPNDRDRAILMAYMAAVVQHKGVKFQWAPLLQGVEGNGKTLFTRCVARAVGERYAHLPRAKEIGERFNAWLFGNIFIGVEDVYIPESRLELLEILKPMITGERNERRVMNTDQSMSDVCANFMFNCNKKEALTKSRNDRRLGILFTAQQAKEDLERDGMTGSYFPALYHWLKNEGGYAIVTNELFTHAIPDALNPARGHIAPVTSSTSEAINAGQGRAEQEILEAVHAGRPGFAGGWLSSIMLEALLREVNLHSRISPNRRREIVQALGFFPHPGLHEGRTNNNVLPDGRKPRLYIVAGHPSAPLRDAALIARHYEAAQMPGAG